MHAYIHTYIHTYMHIMIYIYIYIHKRTDKMNAAIYHNVWNGDLCFEYDIIDDCAF